MNTSETDDKMKKGVGLTLLGILMGLALGLFLATAGFNPLGDEASPEEVSDKILEVYSLDNPGVPISVMSVEETNGLYKVRLSTGEEEGTYQTVYATKDGEMITQAMINLGDYHTMLENRASFLECLDDEGVEIYGALQVMEQHVVQATALQIQVLGGLEYMGGMYIDCSDDLEACAAEGIEALPSVVYQGEIYPGVMNLEWFEETTGCSLEQ